MAELLLELLSEEIPARMQINAASNLLNDIVIELENRNIFFKNKRYFCTARRLTIVINEIDQYTKEQIEEKKGPRVNAPSNAIEGFLKSMKLETINDLEIRDIKGEATYFFVRKNSSIETGLLLTEIISKILHEFKWPKSMRWDSDKIRWVRPLKNILCIFNGEILKVKFGHFIANNISYGHKFMSKNISFTVNDFDDYNRKLYDSFVILDQNERKKIIKTACEKIATEKNLIIKEDDNLLNEVVGLVEWPNVICGKIEEKFMHLPKEILKTAMKTHQRYFSMEDYNGNIGAFFITVSDIKTSNDQIIIEGNEKVLRSRLADAEFFWNIDLKVRLIDYKSKLSQIIYHEKLGTMLDRVERIKNLSFYLNESIIADYNIIDRSVDLIKCDLLTNMVSEFPELQGIIGKYYAIENGEDARTALAISEHYLPKGQQNDLLPTMLESGIIAIADKIDLITSLFSINEKPTGSKDPYALRRAALGIIKIIIDKKLSISLNNLISHSIELLAKQKIIITNYLTSEILVFFIDRLKYYLRAENIGSDIVDASLSNFDLIYDANLKARYLAIFLETNKGKEFLSLYRRIANIIGNDHINNKNIDDKYLVEKEEQILVAQVVILETEILSLIKKQDYESIFLRILSLSKYIDEYFKNIMVNCADEDIKRNRVATMLIIKNLFDLIADFSLIVNK